ncbi:MAG TPA: serine/threonine-protein kinase [Polyangia bacterium]
MLRGTYRILHQLGSGGMGRVYAAAHARLPGLFAVKALHRDFSQNETAVVRFRTEAEIMAGLRHPHIVQVFDFDVAEDGTPYLVMEFIEGQNLSERLNTGETLSPVKVGRLITQIASALDAAHRRGVVHRDLKPENIMLLSELGQEDFVKVVDFGISKAYGGHRITSESTILGTPQYMAPEQAQGRHDEVDPRTDQFSLASMAYTLLTGVEPFRGEEAVTVLYQVVHEPATPVAQHVNWSCAMVDVVLAKAMSKSVTGRYGSILEFAKALEQAIQVDLQDTNLNTTTTLKVMPGPVSFVSRSRSEANTGVETVEANLGVPVHVTSQRTLVVSRGVGLKARRPHAGMAVLGLAAAALLAVAEFHKAPVEALRSVLFAVPAPAVAAPASNPSTNNTP